MKVTTRAVLSLAAASCALLHTGIAAAFDEPTDSFWAPHYFQAPGTSESFANGAVLSGLNLTPVNPPPQDWASGGFPAQSFFDVFVEIDPFGGSPGNFHLQGTATANVGAGTPDNSLANTIDYPTQITQLDFAGPSGVDLRLTWNSSNASPPTTSTDTHVGPGDFRIHSFFDVFVDLSLDGGLTWSPPTSTAPITVTAMPEPQIYAMLLAGLGMMGLYARRRARSAT
jgi:hypothetical protein